MRRKGGFRKVEEIAAGAGALLPRSRRGRHLRALAAWRSAVGERLSRSTRVARVDGGLWTVQVLDAAYKEPLLRLESEILARVRKGMGREAPRKLRLEVSPGFWRPPYPATPRRDDQWSVSEPPTREPSRAAETPRKQIPDPATVLGEEDARCIRDPEQRRAWLRIANRYLARSCR